MPVSISAAAKAWKFDVRPRYVAGPDPTDARRQAGRTPLGGRARAWPCRPVPEHGRLGRARSLGSLAFTRPQREQAWVSVGRRQAVRLTSVVPLAATAGHALAVGTDDVNAFAAMYGGADSLLSPRLAWSLWAAAVMLADAYADEDSWDLLKDALPPLAQRAADGAWMARFVLTFDAIASGLARGRPDPSRLAACTGEEMALHLVIDQADSLSNDGASSPPESLPEDAERDGDFERARDVVFRDHDVLLLFDPAFDGLDDPESELQERFRFANLHPRRWFLPFADQPDVESESE